MRASLLARDPVIAEKHHRNEKAYLDKVVSGHSKAPAWTISEPLFNHGGLAIVGRKTSKIEQFPIVGLLRFLPGVSSTRMKARATKGSSAKGRGDRRDERGARRCLSKKRGGTGCCA
jgi:hypothetical protein